MKRKIVHSESEFVQYLVKLCNRNRIGVAEMEGIIGVEFAFQDGTYVSDEDKLPEGTDVSRWSEQPCDFTKYRKTKTVKFPKTYPTMLLAWVEDDCDRGGPVGIRLVEFVELAEFSLPRNRPRMPLPGA